MDSLCPVGLLVGKALLAEALGARAARRCAQAGWEMLDQDDRVTPQSA